MPERERHPVESLEVALAQNAVLFGELYPELIRSRGDDMIVCDNCVSGTGEVKPVSVARAATRNDWDPRVAEEHHRECDGTVESAEATGCKAEEHPVEPTTVSDVVDLCPTCSELLRTGKFVELADRNTPLPGIEA